MSQGIFDNAPKTATSTGNNLQELPCTEAIKMNKNHPPAGSSLQEPIVSSKIKTIPDGYRSRAFSIGASMICKNRKEFKEKLANICLEQDKTIILTYGSNKKYAYFRCYFSIVRKHGCRSELNPKRLCPFDMKGRVTQKTEDSEEYVLMRFEPNHNHPLLVVDSLKAGKSNLLIPYVCKTEVIDLYRKGLPTSEIYDLVSAKHPDLFLSFEKLQKFLDKKGPKYDCTSLLFFEVFFCKNVVDDELVTSKSPKAQRIFITNKKNIRMWNGLRDVLLIDTSKCIDAYFKLMIMMITIDAFGELKLVALSLCRFKSDKDYDWVYERFKSKGFISPKVIIMDTDDDDSIKRNFTASSLFFTYRSLRRRIKYYMIKSKLNEDAFKKRFSPVFHSKTEQIFENEWIGLINEYPTLGKNAEFMSLYDQRDKWAMYSVKKVFTAEIFCSKGMKCIERSCENVASMISSNSNTKIFSKLSEQFEMLTYKFTYDILYEIPDTGTVLHILKEIVTLQNSYSDFCISHLIASLRDLELCKYHSKANNNIEIIDGSLEKPKIFEVNNDCSSCSCEKMAINGIPCAHLLCAYISTNKNSLNKYISMNINPRGLLPQSFVIAD